jgi:hypothetical protein
LPRDRRRLALRLALVALGGALPLAVTGVVIAAAGAWDHFWLWTFQYARAYACLRTPADGLADLRDTIRLLFRTAPALWILAGLGAIPLFYEAALRRFRLFMLGLALVSIFGVCPGWYFRGHYFLLLLPAAGLLAGVTAQSGHGLVARLRSPAQATALVLLLFSGAVLWTLFQSRAMFFQVSPRQVWRSAYSPALFAEAVEVGEYLRLHCPPAVRIVVLGSEPEIYFYSHRRSATGHIYMYPLMEPQPYALAMQQEMIREIESSNPDYFVWVHDKYSWLQRENSPVLILDWLQNYGREHLELVAWLEKAGSGETQYHWTAAGEDFSPQSQCWLGIYKNHRTSR